MEQERLSEEIDDYDDMTAVNAFQAITIYMLLRVSSPVDENANFDMPMIRTMSKLAVRAQGITMKYCAPNTLFGPLLQNWVLVESLRRTVATLFVFDFLFEMRDGIGEYRCDGARLWAEMLLPSSKALWEAQSEAEWRRQYQASGNDCRLTCGELVRHEQLSPARAQLLEKWMSGADEFGGLIVNAASTALIGSGR